MMNKLALALMIAAFAVPANMMAARLSHANTSLEVAAPLVTVGHNERCDGRDHDHDGDRC